jgi:hypothetical protein
MSIAQNQWASTGNDGKGETNPTIPKSGYFRQTRLCSRHGKLPPR